MPCSLAVQSDRRLLRRLLQNLVSNAIKYTPAGRVLVGCRRRGGRLRIDVYDTGLGIPASKKRAIFQEFHRLDQGAKVARGLGLGLSIVERIARVLDHKIARRVGGRPRIAVLGRGAALRRGSSEARTNAWRREVDRVQLSGITVLCIDNDLGNSRRHGNAARRLGLPGASRRRISRPRSPSSAEAEASPDGLLVDYHLDDGNGIDSHRRAAPPLRPPISRPS